MANKIDDIMQSKIRERTKADIDIKDAPPYILIEILYEYLSQNISTHYEKTLEGIDLIHNCLMKREAEHKEIQTKLDQIEKRLKDLEEELRDLSERADTESEECTAQIDGHQQAGQEFLSEVNNVFRRFHFLPGFFLSAGMTTKLGVLVGGALFGLATGMVWGDLTMIIGGVAGALPGIFLLFVRRLPAPVLLRDTLSAYYRCYGQSLYYLERIEFFNRVLEVGRLLFSTLTPEEIDELEKILRSHKPESSFERSKRIQIGNSGFT